MCVFALTGGLQDIFELPPSGDILQFEAAPRGGALLLRNPAEVVLVQVPAIPAP